MSYTLCLRGRHILLVKTFKNEKCEFQSNLIYNNINRVSIVSMSTNGQFIRE